MRVLVMVLAASMMACSDDEARPSGPSTMVTIHDTLNATGSTSNPDGFDSLSSGGTYVEVYDDFVSTTSAAIRTVVWQGVYGTASAPSATAFFLAVVPDNGSGFPRQEPDPASPGRPRSVYAETFSPARAGERFDTAVPCTNSNRQCSLYSYSTTLTSPLSINAGVRYWLLIQADVPSGGAFWRWRHGIADNNRAGSSLAGVVLPRDVAFALR